VNASDPDGGTVDLTMNPENLPTGATFIDHGNNTGTFTWQTNDQDAGSYSPTFTASDGDLDSTITVSITINDGPPVNRKPNLSPAGPYTLKEGEILTFSIIANDPDGDPLTLSMKRDGLPLSAAFTDEGNDLGNFTWQASLADEGIYYPSFTASDGLLDSTITVTITVTSEIISGQAFNFPNPFNPSAGSTTINYCLKKRGRVTIKIYDSSSLLVKTLENNAYKESSVKHEAEWDGRNQKGHMVSNDIYFCIIETENGDRIVHKIAVLR
ncbi:putative Ig domain-containing protein, partial [bacterium]|nr:putative Ig domain-containing protein [bacterium]